MNDPVWRVVVNRRVDDVAEALEQAHVVPISGHGTASSWKSTLLLRAPDEDAARKRVEDALAPQAFVDTVERVPAYVSVPIDEALRNAFIRAAGTDSRIGGVIDDEQGHIEAYFVLDSKSPPELRNETRGLYERVLRDARLPPKLPEALYITGLHGFPEFESRARKLQYEAHRLWPDPLSSVRCL